MIARRWSVWRARGRSRQLGIIFADIELRVEPPKGGTLDPNGGWATEPSCTLA